MAKKKKNFYVVWQGKKPGIYESWEDCKEQIEKIAGAQFMGFYTRDEAELAYSRTYEEYKGNKGKKDILTEEVIAKHGKPIGEAIAVDAAFNGKTKMMEYKGVFVETSTQLFHFGPIKGGSNNIGEFLALVHALAYQKKNKIAYPVYSDSKTAIAWVRSNKCKSTVDLNSNKKLINIIQRAEKWLRENDYSDIKILKWKTEVWGEIPADFGRK